MAGECNVIFAPVQRPIVAKAAKMKAIVYEKYGTPDVLELREVPQPVQKDNEVLIKVYAVSLNDWDLALIRPDLFNRLFSGFAKPRITIAGSDVAGRVEALGKNVTKFRVGDHVYGDLSGRWGGFAEYVCAPEDSLALKPATMTFEEAAAIPQAGMLAVQGLLDVGKLQSGQKVLVNGAGGGVGTFAIQLARSFNGVEMTGVDNTAKLELMRSMGYDHVIDYGKEDFTRNGKQYDLILDARTSRSPFAYLRALRRGGIYSTVGGHLGRLLQTFVLSPLIWRLTGKRVTLVALKANKDLAFMNELFEAGKMKPVIDGPYRLDEVPNAFRFFNKGLHKGKVVFTVARD